MVINLKKIFITDGEELPIRYELNMRDCDVSGICPLKKPVTVTGRIFNRAGLVSLNLKLVFTYSAPCDRCGLPTDRDYTVELKKSLAPEIESEDSDSIIVAEGMKLDLDELVYTEVVLALPTKHLCRTDCKGICIKCGKNLNSGECSCETKEIDPRFAELAKLLED